MYQQQSSLGLCIACMNVAQCELSATARRPVIQCAQFEPYPPRPSNPVARKVPNPIPPRETYGAETRTYRGLCVNCEKRHSCTFPRASGGVWRCEEYQ